MLICYYLNLSALRSPSAAAVAQKMILWPERTELLMRLRRPEDRLRSLGASYLMSRFLVKECGQSAGAPPRLAYGPQGKPYLPDYPDIHFSISHSGQYAVLAVGEEPCGVDVEQLHDPQRYERIAAHFFLPGEKFYLDSMAKDHVSEEKRAFAFLRIWTRKEAYLKLTGSGFSGDWNKLCVYPDPPEGYAFSELALEQHLITVCANDRADVLFRETSIIEQGR